MSAYSLTFSSKRLWMILIVGMAVMFGALLWIGRDIYQQAPPIPEAVKSVSGETLYTKSDIMDGQNVWQSMGGMQQGSIWGHGGYLAPDWTADWLHREAEALLAVISRRGLYGGVPENQKYEMHRAAMSAEMRENTYNPAAQTITFSNERAEAFSVVKDHYRALYTGDGAEALALREDYAFSSLAFLTPEEADTVSAFFSWTAWGAAAERPDSDGSYTSNWPHEPLIDNRPTPAIFMWSIISIVLLLAGVALIVWYYAQQYDRWRDDIEPDGGFAQSDFMDRAVVTPSMRATAKYFWLVSALFFLQVVLGIVTAHYAVEGQGIYGLPFAEYFPYAVTRTWHTQLAVLWIAAAWLAAGLYVAPLFSGRDPKYQVFGVNFLFISLIVIVVGAFAGQWAAIHRLIADLTANFWFGHQGYEYVDMGRFWQIYLAIGLALWVALVLRALWPAFREGKNRSILGLVAVSAVFIGALYSAGLVWGQQTHLAIVEYWRWWVVHLWVEGIFEVFATAVISLLFVQMGLVRSSTAAVMVLFSAIVFLFGGVLGTFHHLYFTGTPVSVIAAGASFSALEVVPLLVVGFEAYNHKKLVRGDTWQDNYHWPFMFFSAVLFWNCVGAGLFGFMINPPIALYYMQGLHTTANHGHAALFGVYGMLGLGLMLYCMRGLTDLRNWSHKLLKTAFWSLNIGMGMMTFLSLLPQGIWQTYASVKYSYAYARSAEFIQSDVMQAFVWARVPGDIVFAVGVIAFVVFVYKAFTGARRTSPAPERV
ncbi:MAG: nitric-oxide reductase large subunit [Rhodospirillales bacterium]